MGLGEFCATSKSEAVVANKRPQVARQANLRERIAFKIIKGVAEATPWRFYPMRNLCPQHPRINR